MTFDKFMEHFPDTPVTAEQVACVHYLERQGKLRFMIDFGYISAPDIVWRELDEAGNVQ